MQYCGAPNQQASDCCNPHHKKLRREKMNMQEGVKSTALPWQHQTPCQQHQQPHTLTSDEQESELFDTMIAGIHWTHEQRGAAETMIPAEFHQQDIAACSVRRAAVDNHGNQCCGAPNPQASAASSTDQNYAENVRATLDDGIFRGHCSVIPCILAYAPLYKKCNWELCDKYVHCSCQGQKNPNLLVGDLGAENERVYCSR